MAEVVDQMPPRRRGRPAKYDWATLLNGEVHRLRHNEDFPDVQDSNTFRMMVYTAAKRASTNVHVHIDEQEHDVLYIQQYEARS